MNIVCIAWGSLLWHPAPLRLASGWHPGGPRMPVEYVRVSDDNPEVALAVCESAPLAPTYWAYLDTADLDEARAMLAAREKITRGRPDWVGSVPAADGARADPRVAAWLRARGIDAAVWTALPPKFAGEDGRSATAEEIIATLDGYRGQVRKFAEEYIRRTPAHIDTPYRRQIAARLGWAAHRDAHVTRTR